ncbi:dATP/dGTP pyrophosphohydrolase domain-containing protein [Escherichia coli]|uniref:dATP/dGTP pyrophosphohydrolase domain-containing protein n=1 Tax=Escherichia coli TaxID=562 RepID=UPI0023AFEADE|nr:dATP/dGTP pyrophosphohydrolase domain-containing protein [Escherichia coli]
MASLEREQIRHEHAKWSDSTFGCVGPIGPLKHLSKEALEAAAEPDDLSEWADMQFLLWDAQRRAGISDAEINVAMEDKLKINMERQWPEPKDGEPRLHIKEPGNSPVTPDGWISCSERMPKGYADVLVTDGEHVEVKWWDESGYWNSWTELNSDIFADEITHWMPLPEPPL